MRSCSGASSWTGDGGGGGGVTRSGREVTGAGRGQGGGREVGMGTSLLYRPSTVLQCYGANCATVEGGL